MRAIKQYAMRFRIAADSKVSAQGKQLAGAGKKWLMDFGAALKNSCVGALGALLRSPSSLADYSRAGDVYVAKRLLFRMVIGIVIFVGVIVLYVLPALEGRLWAPVVTLNSEKYHAFTGVAKVVDRDGALIYFGALENGIVSGSGKLYQNGELVYEGMLANNSYEGNGTLYEDGHRVYEGGFSNNVRAGAGTAYYASGRIRYRGAFLGDAYEGAGAAYEDTAENRILYRGEFSAGQYNGKGKLFSDGNLVYAGAFSEGKFFGEGKCYDAATGAVLYAGAFSEGAYAGAGRLYGADGKLMYDGNFAEGKFDGMGRQYSMGGKRIYEGQFAAGRYDGQGSLYDARSGRLLYEGGFAEGLYSGEGILYSAAGRLVYQGRFFAGMIDFAALLGRDVDHIREIFGKEDELKLRTSDFLLLYHRNKTAFVFDFAANGTQPIFKKVIFFGAQNVDGVKIGQSVRAAERALNVPYSGDSLAASEAELFFIRLAGAVGDSSAMLYRLRYQKEEIEFTIYSDSPQGIIRYYEMSGAG